MAADSAEDLADDVDELNARFAALIADGRPEILRTFARRFKGKYGFIAENGAFREQAMATASFVVGDVVRSVPGRRGAHRRHSHARRPGDRPGGLG